MREVQGDGPLLWAVGLGKEFTVHELNARIAACRDVEFSVAAGEFVGITGRSGSGKSTLLKMVYRSYLTGRGEIWYRSADGVLCLSTATERRIISLRRREIGYVSQFLQSAPRSTARALVEASARAAGIGAEAAAGEGERILEYFELGPQLRDAYATTFSGGEKLRLNLAMAMVKRPRLLLLDEPTASLDQHSKERVGGLLSRLKDDGTTILGIFHDLEFMRGLCDREYAMQDGSLAEARR